MYEPVLFVHVFAAILLFMAVAVELFAGARLRRAATVEEVRTLVPVTLMIEPLFPISTLLLLLSGFYMATERWNLSEGWIVVAVVTLVVFAIAGPTIQGRRFKGIRAEADAASTGPLPDDLRARLIDPVTWGSVHAMSAGAVGIVWLMTNKPSMALSVAVVAGLTLLGFLGGVSGARRAATA
jgi:hypothetical protein